MSIQHIAQKCMSLGMTKAGAAGATTNILHESGGRANNVEDTQNRKLGISDDEYVRQVDAGIRDFLSPAGGFGLCQWTARDRRERFYKWIKQHGASIADENLQFQFMAKEMREYYPHVWLILTTTKDPYEAGYVMCKEFEIPANTEATSVARGNEAVRIYNDLSFTDPVVPAKTEYWPPRTVDKNMSGPDVEVLQAILKARGYDINYVSGKFTDLTETEVKKFQQDHGLVVDGIAGPKSWAAILERR